jgi:hypothetical protein
MRNADRGVAAQARWAALAACCAGLLCGCTTNPAPKGWLPRAEQAPQDRYGGWIVLELTGGTEGAETSSKQTSSVQSTSMRTAGARIAGELIAIGSDSVLVLPRSGGLVAVPNTRIAKGELWGYTPPSGVIAAWSVLGTLSTASNGGYLILTAPAWIVGGSLASSSASRASRLRWGESGEWVAARRFARFPAGLPEGLDRTRLTPKP